MENTIERPTIPLSSDRSTDGELPYSLALELTVTDRDVIAELWQYAEGEPRDEFALVALRIGISALRQARGQIDADLVRRESERMLTTLESQLRQHSESVERQLTTSLKEYFDPTTGRFNERIERLVKRDGELERLLRAQIGEQDSELCKALAAHIGEQSPLMKKLNPEQKDGFLSVLSQLVEQELKAQSTRILNEFSLDNQDGALNRLVVKLTDKHELLGKNLKERIDEVVKAFSLNDEQSFFSQLRRTLDKTTETINNNLTLDDENSSLARLQREVRKILQEHGETNQKFQEEVKTALAKMAARREERDASTRHGMVFEDAVAEFLQQQAQQRCELFERTGNRVGLIKNCKVGDFVWELGPETVAPGATIVIESKEEIGYTLVDARKEIAQARDNRGAQIGLFVFSRRTAPQQMEPFCRLGNDIFVVWDAEDTASDIHLKAGVDVARALCLKAQNKAEAQAADFTAIDAAILEIEKRANSLEEVCKWAETIRSNSEKIIDRANKAREAVNRQVANLQERITDLKELSQQ